MAQEIRMVNTVNAGSDEDRANQRISFADNDDADNYGGHPSGNSMPRRTSRCKIYIIATVVVLLIVAAIAAAIAVQFATRRLNQRDNDSENTTDINNCDTNPCKNGGSCEDLVYSFNCTCPPGYDGTSCEIDINDCDTDPCKNGGSCEDLINSFNCTCPPGYDGTNCEIDINDCDTNPCKNGGSCEDLVNSFNCTCPPGYDGMSCEIDINDCDTNPCKNGGSCEDLINSFNCTCPPGYDGTSCEIDINDCDSNPCKNGGSCEDLVNSFTCTCPPGYDGTSCSIVHGGWGQWSQFSNCSEPCGEGSKTRQRYCDSPARSNGGNHCPGAPTDIQTCNNFLCLDCSGFTTSGVYNIFPSQSQTEPVPVYCEVSSDGAWTVIQKRIDGSVDFQRTWAVYRTGFGNVGGEYWIGNEALHHITSRGNYKLKVVLTDWEGVTKVAHYSTVRIGSESDGYRLTVRGFSGDAGDPMAGNNGEQFSTTDNDNDVWSFINCAEEKGRGGWWYGYCGEANLNGVYHHTPSAPDEGIFWWTWNRYDSLKATTMMIQKT